MIMKTHVSRTIFSAASLATVLLASTSVGATGQNASASNARAQGLIQHASLAADRLPPGLASVQGVTAPDEGVVADMNLINTLLQQGKTDQALKAIDALQKKRPTDVVPPFLRGRALLQKGDKAGARQAMEQALQIDANYFPAI
ncbi:MAG: tetratricopeptide repeat protein, partial [Proteobacteria bacterium]|nr:tetratricopeptide repeat protein [Pseudomonadota bacterium]